MEQAVIYKAAGDLRYDMIEDEARENRCLTAFNRKIKEVRERKRIERIRADEAAKPHPRREYNIADPNDFAEVAEDMERRIGENRSAFVFGGNPVVMRTMELAMGRIVKRDAGGNKIMDHNGEPETDPAFTTQAKVIKSPDIRRLASKVGYFVVVDERGHLPGRLSRFLGAAFRGRGR